MSNKEKIKRSVDAADCLSKMKIAPYVVLAIIGLMLLFSVIDSIRYGTVVIVGIPAMIIAIVLGAAFDCLLYLVSYRELFEEADSYLFITSALTEYHSVSDDKGFFTVGIEKLGLDVVKVDTAAMKGVDYYQNKEMVVGYNTKTKRVILIDPADLV